MDSVEPKEPMLTHPLMVILKSSIQGVHTSNCKINFRISTLHLQSANKKKHHQTNIHVLILVCLAVCNVQMISATAHSSQNKLIVQSLPIKEQGICYSNFAFTANKDRKGQLSVLNP